MCYIITPDYINSNIVVHSNLENYYKNSSVHLLYDDFAVCNSQTEPSARAEMVLKTTVDKRWPFISMATSIIHKFTTK